MERLLAQAAERVCRIVWGPWTIAFFIGVGVWFSAGCKWLQLRRIPLWMRESVGKYFRKENRKDLSGLKSVCTMLAATIGTGNLAGVAAAMIAGGPGAIFWMWIAAIIGMMTAFAENVLGVLYRGDAPGPMSYIRTLPGGRHLAKIYGIFCLLCGLAMGNLTQANTAASAMKSAFGLEPVIVAAILIIAIGIVFSGGRRLLGNMVLFITPVMSLLFFLASGILLLCNWNRIPAAFFCIFREAFCSRAVIGGAAGYGIARAMQIGISRGVFTNEAGIGTSVFANEQNERAAPLQQGFLAIFAVFFDTIVMCTLTALLLLTSGVYDTGQYAAAIQGGMLEALPDAAALLVQAFQSVFHRAGGGFLAVLTLFFAFSTLLAWSGFAKQAFVYLTGQKGILLFEFLFLAVIAVGSYAAAEAVWDVSDAVNGGMALINLTALSIHSREVLEYTDRCVDELSKK